MKKCISLTQMLPLHVPFAEVHCLTSFLNQMEISYKYYMNVCTSFSSLLSSLLSGNAHRYLCPATCVTTWMLYCQVIFLFHFASDSISQHAENVANKTTRVPHFFVQKNISRRAVTHVTSTIYRNVLKHKSCISLIKSVADGRWNTSNRLRVRS